MLKPCECEYRDLMYGHCLKYDELHPGTFGELECYELVNCDDKCGSCKPPKGCPIFEGK